MPAMVRNHISRFEALARRLVEGSVGRLIGDDGLTLKIASHLAHAVEQAHKGSAQPIAYYVFLNPADLRSIEAGVADLEQQLTRYVATLAQSDRGSVDSMAANSRASTRLVRDETIGRGDVAVEPSYEREAGSTTAVLNQLSDDSMEQLRLLDAFLIVNGRRHVALDKPLIRIGRRIDNDVIIDVPTVSRQHAHIRWRNGRFIIFDVGSRGGVQLNGGRIIESVLVPGDLITLSEQVPLIYGEGLESRQSFRKKGNGTQDTLAYTPEDD